MIADNDDESTLALAVAVLDVKIGIISDDLDDYETESIEYRSLEAEFDKAYSLYKKLTAQIIDILAKDGFENRNGWWIKKETRSD